jgi:hypothetical protein
VNLGHAQSLEQRYIGYGKEISRPVRFGIIVMEFCSFFPFVGEELSMYRKLGYWPIVFKVME